MKSVLSKVSLCLLVVVAPQVRADDDKGALKALIAKAVAAQGGAELMEKYKAAKAKFKGKVQIAGTDIDVTGTTTDMMPDKMKLEMEFEVMGTNVNFKQIINGDKGWQVVNGTATDLTKEMLAEAREQRHASEITNFRGINAKGVKLSPLGEVKVGDRETIGVRVSQEGFRDVNLYIDKEDYHLLKSETKGKDPMMGDTEYNAETLYGDYKKVKGLLAPHKVTIKRDGKPFLEMELSDLELSEKLDDSVFAKPS
jgi:hypothetical protein